MANLIDSLGSSDLGASEQGSDAAPGLPYGTAPDNIPKPVVSLEEAINYMRSYGGSTSDLHNRADWAQPGVNSISYFIPLLSAGTMMNGAVDQNGVVVDTERAAYTQMSAFKVSQAVRAFELWDDLMAFDLNRISSVDANGVAANTGYQNMIQFYYHTATSGTAAPTYYIAGSEANSLGGIDRKVWGATVEFQQSDFRSNDDVDVALGELGFEFFLHEIGHTLGLWHPGPYNGASPVSEQVYMFQDNVQFTVMSYNRPAGIEPAEFANQAVWGVLSASTPMVYDIAAIQAIYGADPLTRTGADVYGYGAFFSGGFASQAEPYSFSATRGGVFSIYDAGGRDTLSGAIFTDDQFIDLTPGAYSSMGRSGGTTGVDLVFNVGIAFNTIIENASGGSGNDYINGNDADNALRGNAGNDTLIGGLGLNTLSGGEGDDIYILGDGADVLNDFFGYDTVRFSNASTINFQDGYAIGDPSNDIWSESFIDRIEGSDEADAIILTIQGSGTQDILGYGGNDILGGNADFNKMYGGNGNDYLYGRDGWDTMEGNSGNDELNGDAGNDYLTGGSGDDVINGGSGDFDTADFSDHFGNATVGGGWTFDLVNRTATTSYFIGGVFLFFEEVDRFSGIENLLGSTANDTFLGHYGTYLNGNDGIDTLILGATVPFLNFQFAADDRVDLEQGFSERNAFIQFQVTERQSFGNIEIIHTNIGNDSVIGSARDDVVFGDEGNDNIAGAAGNDTLNGGAGADTLDGGTNTASGDTLSYESSAEAVFINLTDNSGSGGDANGDVFSNFENITGSNISGDTLLGNAEVNVLNGLGGDDFLNGGLGADTLIGGSGTDTAYYYSSATGVTVNLANNVGIGGDAQDDTYVSIETVVGSNNFSDTLFGNSSANQLLGMGGNDVLDGGAGTDTLNGGDGLDTAYYYSSAAGVNVNLATRVGSGGDAAGDTLNSIEYVIGSNTGGDTLRGNGVFNYLAGFGGDDTIDGGGVASPDATFQGDSLDGGEGTDTLSYASAAQRVIVLMDYNSPTSGVAWNGTSGDLMINFENLTGSAHNDVLLANDAANVINGGAGQDSLYGELGADTFRFDTLQLDAIHDFQDGVDKLSFNLATADSFNDFAIFGNGSGNGNYLAVQLISDGSIIVLRGEGTSAVTLDASDFVFV
jgi:Ca2+-binding RTX toxin-like protein